MTNEILNVHVIVEARLLADEPYLAVRVDNASSGAVSARVEAPVVSSLKKAQPGESAYWAIKLDGNTSGVAEVALQQFVGGRLVKDRFSIPYEVE